MIIGFKERFVDKIKSGTKIHTIREDKHDRWSEGRKIYLATGVRTKNYQQFAEKTCTGTQKISIRYYDNKQRVRITIDDRFFGTAFYDQGRISYYVSELEDLARNDGFDSVDEFFQWFHKDFAGKIIHWTQLKY